eukprot:Nitzschia sp. Nitz4//scaffold72_size95085//31156//32369//NITZ4_004752-RA/size95085-snap-gene-0.116-mRNA-1//1//CDS//3329557351//3563//frame0
MFSTSVSQLTRQVSQWTLKSSLVASTSSKSLGVVVPNLVSLPVSPTTCSVRTFAVNRKVIDAKNAKRLKVQAKKKKNGPQASKATDEAPATDDASNQPFLQHQEWVKFQQSIAVDGFQTGQVTTAQVLKKSRGGKQARARREKEMAKEAAVQTDASLKFPALRYSEEETQELLNLAFATLPEREGKRGSRNLKRQDRRWKLVRDIRSKYKRQIQQAHERRMEKRSWRRETTKEAKEAAPAQCQADLDYQAQVLRRWSQTMVEDPAVVPAGKAKATE